jgi:hypothetical protein
MEMSKILHLLYSSLLSNSVNDFTPTAFTQNATCVTSDCTTRSDIAVINK